MKKEEFAEALGDINEDYIKEARKPKKNKISVCVKWVAVAACLAVVVAVAVFVPRQTTEPALTDQDGTEDVELADSNDSDDTQAEDVELADSNNPDDASDDARLQEQIRELQAEDSFGDSLGWLVVDDKIYVQSDVEYRETDEDISLGKASSFTGNYQDGDGCDGDVYAAYANSNIIYIKLDNGGTVILEEKTE
jgi:hypothetical protein